MQDTPLKKPSPGRDPSAPMLVPCLLLRRGRVCLPGPKGPVQVQGPRGEDIEVLDLVDWLSNLYSRLYVLDLDGIERDRPQLDYLQEISKSCETWVDAGLRTGEQAIDVIVAGASRAVVSSTDIESLQEVRRAWRLSPDIVFELEVEDGHLHHASSGFSDESLRAIVDAVHEIGITDLVWNGGEGPVDWSMVRTYAPGGRLWVGGGFSREDAPRLGPAGAAGGIFQIHREIETWMQTLTSMNRTE